MNIEKCQKKWRLPEWKEQGEKEVHGKIDTVEQGLKVMENMKFVCSDKRPEGMEQDFTGSEGSLRTAAVEEEEEEQKKKKKKKKKNSGGT